MVIQALVTCVKFNASIVTSNFTAMRILKKLICLFLTTAMVFACEDTKVEPFGPGPGNPGVSRTSQPFEATLDLQKISATPIEYDPVLSLQVGYEGTGTSNIGSPGSPWRQLTLRRLAS